MQSAGQSRRDGMAAHLRINRRLDQSGITRNYMGPLPHCGSFSWKKMKVKEENLSPSPNGPVKAVISVNVTDSTVECLDLDNYRI